MNATAFWDVLAPYHSTIEDNFLDLASARRLLTKLREPVLVVGAGQGLIVSELRSKQLKCDGVDFSPEMVRQAKRRRGLDLVQADARAMPFADGAYATIIYATGVIDFNSDEQMIQSILAEGRRVVKPDGALLVAFYRISAAQERFLLRVGLLRDHVLSHRQSMELYPLTPGQMVGWVANRAGVGRVRATAMLLRMAALTTVREKRTTFKLQQMFRQLANPNDLLQAAQEKQPYRDEPEIRALFHRLAVPVETIMPLPTCWVARIRTGTAGK